MLDSTRSHRLFSLVGAALALLLSLFLPALAKADTSSTLTVVGTSDVSDSGLIPNLIAPEFENAYPQFTFKYVGSATGTAIQNAESGNGGPSALIVHAASLENQFVAGGFSYKNQYGTAIFRNDFVLAGPTGDPAGVTSGGNPSNNIAQAFADVAAAGVAGHATFISRGGTNTAPGTTVAEHQMWALMDSAGLTPSGVLLCNVTSADGGGETPIKSGVATLAGNVCPDSGTVDGTDAPPWYIVNSGVNQATNVEAGNACTLGTSGANTCYVFTDRGTFDFLSVGAPAPGNTQQASLIPNLKIVARDNSGSAPGGANALINYFHVYIINPSVSGETVNLTAAQDFVKFLTSPALQAQLANYLKNTPDPGGAPFVADASPIITASGLPAVDLAGKAVTVRGTVTNAEVGYPALSGVKVAVDEIEGGIPVPVKTGTTSSNGGYQITFTPTSSGHYQLSTGQISMIENSTLNPVFGDILSPGASPAKTMNVQSTVTVASAHASFGGVTVSGRVAPAAVDGNANVAVLARPAGSSSTFRGVGGSTLHPGQSTFAADGSLRPGRWQVEVRFSDPGQVLAGVSAPRTVTVPQGSTTVGFGHATVNNGAATVTGKLGSAPAVSGAKVELLGMRTGSVKKQSPRRTRARSASLSPVGQTQVAVGATTFTIRAKLSRGFSWILQLEYVQPGQPAVYSRLRSLAVH
jgi:ABC-type tungstate transport system permease subunit